MRPISSNPQLKPTKNLVAVGLSVALVGCAGGGGISCPASAPRFIGGIIVNGDDISNIRCWSNANNQVAQYRLGIAYERGQLGLPVDLKSANKFYSRAARPRSGTTYVYSPPVGNEVRGRVLPMHTGADRPGLPQAMEALQRLNGGIVRD